MYYSLSPANIIKLLILSKDHKGWENNKKKWEEWGKKIRFPRKCYMLTCIIINKTELLITKCRGQLNAQLVWYIRIQVETSLKKEIMLSEEAEWWLSWALQLAWGHDWRIQLSKWTTVQSSTIWKCFHHSGKKHLAAYTDISNVKKKPKPTHTH